MNIEFLLSRPFTRWFHPDARLIERLFYNEITSEQWNCIDYQSYKEHKYLSPRLIARLVYEQKDIPFVFECGNCQCDLRKNNYHPWEEPDSTDYEFVCDDCHFLYRLTYVNNDTSDDDSDDEEKFDFIETCQRVVRDDDCVVCMDNKKCYSFFPTCEHVTCFDCFIQMKPMKCVFRCGQISPPNI